MSNYIDPTNPFGFEIDFLPVGNGDRSGDAICMRWGYNLQSDHPDQFVMVVDGGFAETGDQLVNHIPTYYKTHTVNLVVNTHPHADHVRGLHAVLEQLFVKRLWIHQPWNHQELSTSFRNGRFIHRNTRPKLIDGLESAFLLVGKAKRKGVCVEEPFAPYRCDSGCGVAISVLGPWKDTYDWLLPGFKALSRSVDSSGGNRVECDEKKLVAYWQKPLDENGATSAENNSSVVLYLQLPNHLGGVLLTGDAGIPALHDVCATASRMNIDFTRELQLFQIPHHGSIQNLTPQILDALFGSKSQAMLADGFQRFAYASVSEDSDCMHPSKHVINALCERNVTCFQTKGITMYHQFGCVPKRHDTVLIPPCGPYSKVEWTYINQ